MPLVPIHSAEQDREGQVRGYAWTVLACTKTCVDVAIGASGAAASVTFADHATRRRATLSGVIGREAG
jgi:hypothetical protein